MTDRLDRIEGLLETLSTSQPATQSQLDRLAVNQAEIQATQREIQVSQQATQRHLESLVSTAADMRTRQIITQNQIDSLAALSTDTRQALTVLLQTSVQHEGRLGRLEQGEDESTT